MANEITYVKVPLKNIFNIPRVVSIHCYDLAPDYRYRGEVHDFWEIYFVDRGECTIIVGDEYRPAKQGDMIFIPPNIFHNVECDGVHSASLFIITFDCRSSAMKYFSCKTVRLPRELAPIMKRLIDESVANFTVSHYPLEPLPDAPIGGLQLVRIYLEELLICLLRHEQKSERSGAYIASKGDMDGRLVSEIRTYLEANVRSRVTVEDIVERFHFGKSHLYDIFKEAYGESIMGYHSRLKIEEAKRLLREERLAVGEIAEMLSYESPEYFSRAFKKATGISPRAFRGMLISSSRKKMKGRR